MNKIVLISPPDSLRSAHDVFSEKTAQTIKRLGIQCVIINTYPNWFGASRIRGKSLLKHLFLNPLLRIRIFLKLKHNDYCIVLNAIDSKDTEGTFEKAIKAIRAKYCLYLIDNHFSITTTAKSYFNRAKLADKLLVVTPQLAEEAYKHGICSSKVRIIEEPIDIDRLDQSKLLSEKPSIVWTGNPGNTKYLHEIGEILKNVYKDYEFKLTVISGRVKPSLPFEFPWDWRPYSFNRENIDLEGFWLGLAPIERTEYSKCKDTYKIKTYFAKGIPAVATNYGYHPNLIKHGSDGFLCDSREDWVKYIKLLLSNRLMVSEMSHRARDKAEIRFSHEQCVADWLEKLV